MPTPMPTPMPAPGRTSPWIAVAQILGYSALAWVLTVALAAAWSALGPRSLDADTIALSAFLVAVPVLLVSAVAVLRDLPDPAMRLFPKGTKGLSLFVATVIPGLELFVLGGLIGT